MTTYPRNCYCQNGTLPHLCGPCEVCGKPGHTAHVPAPLPLTGSWCDQHHDLIAWAFDDERAQEPCDYCRIRVEGVGDYLVELQRDMAMRIVLVQDAAITRFTHGDFRVGFSPWTSPMASWPARGFAISEREFASAWSAASPPA